MFLASKTYSQLFITLAVGLVGCSGENGDAEPQISMFTGHLETADLVVGLAVSPQGNVDAYVCADNTNVATYSRWFAGAFSATTASLDAGNLHLDLTMQGQTANVALTTPDGVVHATVIQQAGAKSRSALYESPATTGCRWGVIVVDEGGDEPAVHGTWCDRTTPVAPMEAVEIYAQVTPVRPFDFSKDVLAVLVTTPEGEQRLEVHRARVNRAIP